MIANVSPSSLTYEDTYNTLKYATRAMKIKSNVRQNVVAKDINCEQYVIMIDNLKAEVERLKAKLEEYENDKNTINETITLPSTSSSLTATTVPTISLTSILDVDKEKLMDIVDELKKLLERIHQLEMVEQGLGLRKQLKEDKDARLSDLCDSTDKIKGRKRIGDAVDRIKKQVSSLKDEIYHTKEKKKKVYENLEELLRTVPDLKELADVEKIKLGEIEAVYKAELHQKKCERLTTELNSRAETEKKMSNLLKICYRYLQAQNQLPESVKSAYNTLKNDWQGIHSVTFEPEPEIDSTVIIDDTRKRKVEEICSSSSLDSTFAIGSKSQPVLTSRAKELISKESPMPPRKFAKFSPAIKENKAPTVRKPTAIMGTSQRFQTTKSTNLLNGGKSFKKK
nr:kinesin-like protein KIF18A [Onthophagus taurus]